MNKLFLLVLVTVGLFFSSACAGEVLINKETAQIRVESNPWRPANAFEVEAFQNPGTEVPVWSSFEWKKLDFFHSSFSRTATNVIIYRDKKFDSLAKEVVELGGARFLWYKVFLIIGVIVATLGVLLKDLDTISFVAFAAVAFICAIAAFAFAVTCAAIAAIVVACAAIAFEGSLPTAARFFLILYIILAVVAMVV